jgi:hypothetical protein
VKEVLSLGRDQRQRSERLKRTLLELQLELDGASRTRAVVPVRHG